MRNFEYFEPKTVGEACGLLRQMGAGAKVLAGGTDLLVEMRAGRAQPAGLINLKTVSGLNHIVLEDQVLRLGSLVTIAELASSSLVREHIRPLAEAASRFGSPLVSNLGTIGGNLCHAAPSAETAPPLLVFNAMVRLVNGDNERLVPLEQFFLGPGKTTLGGGEILAEIVVPRSRGPFGSRYWRYSRRNALDLAMVGAAVFLERGDDGTCRTGRIALGAVAPTPVRMRRAEACLEGSPVGDEVIRQTAMFASEDCCPTSSKRASAEFKREMVRVTVSRALQEAWSQCVGG